MLKRLWYSLLCIVGAIIVGIVSIPIGAIITNGHGDLFEKITYGIPCLMVIVVILAALFFWVKWLITGK